MLDRQDLQFDLTCNSVNSDNAAGLTESIWWVDIAVCCPRLAPLYMEKIRSFATIDDISAGFDQTPSRFSSGLRNSPSSEATEADSIVQMNALERTGQSRKQSIHNTAGITQRLGENETLVDRTYYQ